jgi:transcriptional regulator with XRE-family HTH domain
MTFGQLLKDVRIDRRTTLRQCSAALGVDASNWSKLERNVNPAPKDITVLDRWADFFQLRGPKRQAFFDLAALSRHELPADIASDVKVLRALPAFFNVARASELDQTMLDQLIEDLRSIHSPDIRKVPHSFSKP